ncbi:MAG TPA: hypothetical protein VH912_06875 [Streptosporangiaceae bacterium]|jgi:hypothetical protein
MSISLSLPETAASRFVVAADEVPKDPYAMARAQITGPPGDEALEWLGTPLLSIRAVAAADSIWRDQLAEIAVLDDEERERLLTAPGHLVIESELPLARRPRAAQAVRAVARALAETTGGLLADLCTAQLIPPDRRVGGERDWFCPADRWLGVDCLINADGEVDGKPTECSCLCLFTRGLSRFGLPELVVDQVACAYDLAATNLLRGLAVRLFGRLWADEGATELHLDETVVVEPGDMWGFWGARPLFGRPIPIALAESRRPGLPGGQRHLELRPPPDYAGTHVEWGTEVLSEGLPSVAGWQPDDPPYRIDVERVVCEGG